MTGKAKDIAAIILADPRVFIEAVRAGVPLLCSGGYEARHSLRHMTSSTFEEDREDMTDKHHVEQFLRAVEWLVLAPKTKTINRSGSSYGWKHVAERWHREKTAESKDCYISNGMFLAACYALGMVVEQLPDSPNARVNLSMRAYAVPA